MGDLSMYAPGLELVDLLEKHDVPVYVYEFKHESVHTPVEWWGTYHSLELDYVFGSPFSGYNIAIDDWANHTDTDKRVSRVVMNYWTQFAKSG